MRSLPSGGAGILGYEVPAAFGVNAAHSDMPNVAVVGNFGFTFHGDEIAATSDFGKPIIIVILSNACLNLIRQNQKGAYGYEYSVDMHCNQDGHIDYVKAAEGYGCKAESVYDPSALKSRAGAGCEL